ncbi:MAG TPA: hypothetical protein VGU65_13415 [Frateuria sp.]|uniref:hypothetical protein n=1 Tax=Frateuria sp. TaxID=2211372 RepID=UPI002DE8C572|nr:hypothetical protein [Frateuria sp.]
MSITLAVASAPALGAVDHAGAERVFSEAKAICQRDAGALWGHSLCGPMLLVDPADRAIVANQADDSGALKATGEVFTGTLPASEIIANTSISWSGVRWSEILWPLPQETAKRHVMLAHEMFHRIQPELGVTLHEGDNQHLDTLEGRYLLQLEWRALAEALRAPSTAARRGAIGDALLFRQERYRRFPGAADNENALESNEGVAEYTGVRLGLDTPQARHDYAMQDLSAFVGAPTFVRSFAYATGPAYGLLLDQADPAWRGKLHSGQRLDQLLATALHLPAPAFDTLAAREKAYDDGTLRASEVRRDQARQARLAALKAKLVDGPVLALPLLHERHQFNPQTLQPLGDFGTAYPTMRLSDDWGVLEVEDGILLNGHRATVSAVGADPAGLKGAGWRLQLNPGWTVVPGARKGDLAVRRAGDMPH